MVFSAVIVRASKEYHADTFMTTDLSLPLATPSALEPPPSAGWPADRKSASYSPRARAHSLPYAPRAYSLSYGDRKSGDPRSPFPPPCARSRVCSPDLEAARCFPDEDDESARGFVCHADGRHVSVGSAF